MMDLPGLESKLVGTSYHPIIKGRMYLPPKQNPDTLVAVPE